MTNWLLDIMVNRLSFISDLHMNHAQQVNRKFPFVSYVQFVQLCDVRYIFFSPQIWMCCLLSIMPCRRPCTAAMAFFTRIWRRLRQTLPSKHRHTRVKISAKWLLLSMGAPSNTTLVLLECLVLKSRIQETFNRLPTVISNIQQCTIFRCLFTCTYTSCSRFFFGYLSGALRISSFWYLSKWRYLLNSNLVSADFVKYINRDVKFHWFKCCHSPPFLIYNGRINRPLEHFGNHYFQLGFFTISCYYYCNTKYGYLYNSIYHQ